MSTRVTVVPLVPVTVDNFPRLIETSASGPVTPSVYLVNGVVMAGALESFHAPSAPSLAPATSHSTFDLEGRGSGMENQTISKRWTSRLLDGIVSGSVAGAMLVIVICAIRSSR